MRKLVLVALVFGLFYSGLAFGAPFTNGSFESPGGSNTRFYLSSAGDNHVTGWYNLGGFQIYETQAGDGITPKDGSWYISWGHNGNTGGTLSQTFDTVAGTTYAVNYFLRTQQGADPVDPEGMKVQAFNGKTVLGEASLLDFTYVTWTVGPELTFTAASTSTTLIFTDITNGGGSANWGLDAVTVNASAVPLPSALLLLGPGLVGIAGIKRRFKR